MRSEHHCHVPGCDVRTRPAMLMCAKHWRHVPSDLQHAVYDTVGQRRKGRVDASWAPWWRAQAKAVNAVLLATGGYSADHCALLLRNSLRFADLLAAREPTTTSQIEETKR